MEDLEMVFEPLPGEALARFLTEHVTTFNIAKTGVSTWYPVGFFLKNARGEWLGGLTGYIWAGWFHVNSSLGDGTSTRSRAWIAADGCCRSICC